MLLHCMSLLLLAEVRYMVVGLCSNDCKLVLLLACRGILSSHQSGLVVGGLVSQEI